MADWQPIETAPKDGREVILAVEYRAGIRHGVLVGHYMEGGHCIEDHPPIAQGWYFWNGCMFDKAAKPTHWLALPHHPAWGAGWQAQAQGGLGVTGTPAPKMRRRLTSDGNGGMCIVTEPDPDGVDASGELGGLLAEIDRAAGVAIPLEGKANG